MPDGQLSDHEVSEIKADAFLRMTGMLSPGKVAWRGPSDAERVEAWTKWNEDHRTILSAMRDAVNEVLKETAWRGI